jgi:pimeloyl-ACP methyl ester carboxylesterase
MSATCLLRLVSVAQSAAAALWLLLCFTRQATAVAWLGVVVIALLHAPMMAVEFAVMHRMNRREALPRASRLELSRAWFAEVVGALRVFGWQQPWRSDRFADQTSPAGRRGVVLVHGFMCNRGLWNRWWPALIAHRVPCIAVNLNPAFTGLDAYVPAVDEAVRRMTACTGRPPLLVAHSMGGLVVRAWLCGAGAPERVHRVITIGTPHQGTWLARFGLAPNARQMWPGSAWLAALAAREGTGAHHRFTCFHSSCDNIVLPSHRATLAGADNRHLRGMAHVHMLQHPAVFAEVLKQIEDTQPAGN